MIKLIPFFFSICRDHTHLYWRLGTRIQWLVSENSFKKLIKIYTKKLKKCCLNMKYLKRKTTGAHILEIISHFSIYKSDQKMVKTKSNRVKFMIKN